MSGGVYKYQLIGSSLNEGRKTLFVHYIISLSES